MIEFEKSFIENEKAKIENKVNQKREIKDKINNYLQRKEKLELELKELNHNLSEMQEEEMNIIVPQKMMNSEKVKRVVYAGVEVENNQHEMKWMEVKYYSADDPTLETPYFIRIDNQDNVETYDSYNNYVHDNNDLYLSYFYDLNDINFNEAWNSIREFVVFNNIPINYVAEKKKNRVSILQKKYK